MASMLSNVLEYCTFVETGAGGTGTGAGTAEEDDDDEEEESNSKSKLTYREHELSSVSQGTTNLSQLKSTIFGKAPLDGSDGDENKIDYDPNHGGVSSSSSSSLISINLIICGIFGKKKEVTYREKQAANLVSYHLQKYASALNCSLYFLREDGKPKHEKGDGHEEGDEEDEGGGGRGDEENINERPGDAFRPRGMTVLEFGRNLKKMCVSDSWDDVGTFESDADLDVDVDGYSAAIRNDVRPQRLHGSGAESAPGPGQQQPSHYGPYDYDVDLINSVLLRGAGCPGVWNANTDSLWVALPSSSTDKDKVGGDEGSHSKTGEEANGAKANANNNAGDQEWLTKLADSVNAYVGSSSMGGGSGSDGKSVRSSMDQTVRTNRTSANGTVVTKKKVARKKPAGGASGDKKDSQDVQDFFAGLLNK